MPTIGQHATHSNTQEISELSRLLTLLQTEAQHATQGDNEEDGGTVLRKSLQWPRPETPVAEEHCEEAQCLEQFSRTYQSERRFSEHPQQQYFSQIFSGLIKFRLANESWSACAPPENILRVLVCVRILMRDQHYQNEFFKLGGIKTLAQNFQKATESYLSYGEGPYVVDILKEMTNMFQKLSTVVEQRDYIVSCGAHQSLVLLLNANDVIVLHCTLHSLIGLSQSPGPRSVIAELNCIEILLRILQDYDNLSKKLSASLLRLLCQDAAARDVTRLLDGVHILLSLLLHSHSARLLWNIVWCLVQLTDGHPDTSAQIRTMGGLPLLLALLHERKFVSERHSASAVSTPGSNMQTPTVEEDIWCTTQENANLSEPPTVKQQEELREQSLRLKSACCACLSELVLNDTNAQQIVQRNGIYSLSLLILPQKTQASTAKGVDRETANIKSLQANAFRTLRFLFSMERHRRHFKRLFPPDLFEVFIDIGHYNKDLSSYKKLVDRINRLSEEQIEDIQHDIEGFNQNKEVKQYIQDYAVLELLGAGAFGSVYKVQKKAGQSYLAMKEVSTINPAWGKSSKERMKSVGEVISELNIIKEELKHPNVVRYYKTFVEQEKLYIVMELIEGAPIGEHFTSLREKGEKFTEERVWKIFIQLVLALRYLHKEKGIVHRDLTPNNIMLGENDQVTITDFGLAKQKQKDCSKMTSLVGTILYSCPEIIQNKPYNDKADIWAIGCVLYQMCTLKAPFHSNNMLTLAKIIVEADYEPMVETDYSPKVLSTVRLCITADPDQRPDVLGVAAHIADVTLLHMDTLQRQHNTLATKLDKERRLRHKHFSEVTQNMQNYHRMYLVSQERYEKVQNLGSSGGAASIKDDSDSMDTPVFSDMDSSGGFASHQRKQQQQQQSAGHRETDEESLNENGWESDCDRADSSGSESREGSAGRQRAPHPPAPLPRSGGGRGGNRKPQTHRPSLPTQESSGQYGQQLMLDIPSPKYSRDSGVSSDDPSPNTMSSSVSSAASSPCCSEPAPRHAAVGRLGAGIQRSLSSNAVEALIKRSSSGSGSPGRARPYSANTATLTISPRRVRQINDPILQMLNQLHKIIYICQLPPTLGSNNTRRKLIERFKRALFEPQSTSFNLKNELRKLLIGSRDTVDLHLGVTESHRLAKQVAKEQQAISNNNSAATPSNSANSTYNALSGFEGEVGGEAGITYEQMQSVIESVLVESGYYDLTPSPNTTPPHLQPHL